MSNAQSEGLLKEIAAGLRSNEDNPVGWLTSFLAELKERDSNSILVDKNEASLVAVDAEKAPVALVVDCGTSETKVLLFRIVDGAVKLEELAKLNEAASYVDAPDSFVDSIHLYLSKAKADVVLVSASEWMRGADESLLAKGNALLQNLMATGVICKILEPKEEAWFELCAAEYADRGLGFGITATWAAGGGSTQITQDYQTVHTFALGNERGRALIASAGPSGLEQWRAEVRSHYNEEGLRLSGTILGLSAVYQAAVTCALPIGKSLSKAAVCDKMQQYVDAQLALAELSREDVRNLSNVVQQLETARLIVEDGSSICFARDVVVRGCPVRVTWSCGWYLHLLEELNLATVKSRALRNFRKEVLSLTDLGAGITSDSRDTSVAPSAAGQVLVDLQRLSQILYRRAEKVEAITTRFLQGLAEKTSSSLVGLEHRFKEPRSLMQKMRIRLRRLLERYKVHPLYMPRVSDVVHEIADILRYTVVIPGASYVPVTMTFLGCLREDLKCDVRPFSFWHPESSYLGVNCYVTLDNFKFEVQFHTDKSWSTKQKDSHELYSAYRLLRDGRAKSIIYRSMKETWGRVPIPPSVELIAEPRPMRDPLMEQIGRIESCRRLYEAGMPAAEAARLDTTELCYRLIRGKVPDEFEHLAYPVDAKRLAWVSQSGSLKDLLVALAASPVATSPVIARAMGKPLAWVDAKLQDGYIWKVAIMPQAVCQKADWNGCLNMVQRYYPEVAAKIAKFRDALIAVPIAEIERQISPLNSFRRIKDAGASHEQFIDLRKLASLAKPQLWHVRGFLFNIIGVNELYKGDGYTYDEEGQRSSEEFMIVNRRVTDIPGCELLTISR